MIIWTGAGILVWLVGILGWAVGYALGGDSNNVIGGGLGLLVAGVLLFLLGRRLNDPSHARVLLDPQTGQPVILQRKHTFFWIPMEFWAVILALGGVAYMIFALVSGERHL